MHKREKKRLLNIMLIPDNQEAPPKSFRVKYSTIYAVVAFLSITLISVVIGIVTYSRVLQAAMEKNEREKELMQLRQQMNVSMELKNQLDSLKAYRDKVRSSLQGYVKFADRAKDNHFKMELLLDAKPIPTLLSSLPFKSPLIGFVSQEFKYPEHLGIDIVAKEGAPIHAAGDGVVLFSDWTNNFGYTVVLYHYGGFITFYRHNAQNLVNVHQKVKQGEVIGLVGNSGISSGPHLHFEIWKNGEPQDPRIYLMDLNNIGE
jgi:murein DD-endopeptidase MepM/ murein hydrolase activator NlpD